MIALTALTMLLAVPATAPKNAAPGYRIQEEVRVEHDGKVETGWERIELDRDHVRRQTSNHPGATIVAAAGEKALQVVGPKGVQTVTRAEIALEDAPGPMMDGIGISPEGEPVVSSEPFRATGRTATIGAWSAREYVATQPGLQGMKTTLWMADRPAGLPNTALLSVLERVFSRPGSRWAPWFEGMTALRGFPVRRVQEYGGTRVTITVTSIERASIPAAEFEAPASAAPAPVTVFDADSE